MLTRIRCLLRIHRWNPEVNYEGVRYKDCQDCTRWRRLGDDNIDAVQQREGFYKNPPSQRF